MESKQNYLGKINQHLDMIELNNIVEEVFGVDIKSSRRFKDIIEARMVFSKILRERGVPYTKIGE
jgi:hypothetical protein